MEFIYKIFKIAEHEGEIKMLYVHDLHKDGFKWSPTWMDIFHTKHEVATANTITGGHILCEEIKPTDKPLYWWQRD